MTPQLLLVAEDNADLRHLICAALADRGYRTLEAADGQAAVVLARGHRPDLILLDLAMPGLDGLGATEQIHADQALAKIPIVAITAVFPLPANPQALESQGVAAVLIKPFTLDELIGTIQQVLWQRGEPAPDLVRGTHFPER